LNLGYLAGFLRQKGHDLEIWDCEVENFSEEGLYRKINNTNPSLIGITCLTPTVLGAHKIASLIKKISKDILIVVGGAHSTALPIETLKEFPDFDLAVIGEGEETLLEILHSLQEKRPLIGIRGTAYREDGTVKLEDSRPYFDDINSLPFPARDLVDKNLYREHHVSRGFSRQFLKVEEIITSRGCPYNCIFCACHNRTVRFRDIGNVIREIEDCIIRYNTSHFSFLDDTLTTNPKHISELCKGMIKFKKITWDCFARVDTVSLQILKEMAASGCRKVSYGVESGSPRILNLIKKNIKLEQVKNAFIWSREAGIEYIEGSFMIGCHPNENRQDIAMTVKLIYEIEPDILMLSITVPYPGTELYKIIKEKGYLNEGIRWDDFTFFSYKPAWRTDYFSASELFHIHRNLLRRFYLRPKYVFKILKKIKNWNEFLYWMKEGIDFVRRTT
jgi:radical SAM superfamily enzyme YgiQ (UPF0313 family)